MLRAAGTILKQMRQMGMKQPVFGSARVVGDALFRNAGAAAEGLEVVYPFDPNRDDPAGSSFRSASTRPTMPKPTHFPPWHSTP